MPPNNNWNRGSTFNSELAVPLNDASEMYFYTNTKYAIESLLMLAALPHVDMAASPNSSPQFSNNEKNKGHIKQLFSTHSRPNCFSKSILSELL